MVQVESVLRELEVRDKRQLLVMNKIDLLPTAERDGLTSNDTTIYVSAMKGIGLDELLSAIDRAIPEDPVRHVKATIPVSDGKALALLEAKARVLQREYQGENVLLEIQAPESVLRRIKQYVTREDEVSG
jgi:GTP-binding protein HflX